MKLSFNLSHPTDRAACGRFTPSNSGQRLPPTYYRGCWHVVSRGLFRGYRHFRTSRNSSPRKEVYDPKAFIPHAASLRQAFAHCARFSTAASRRSLGSVSVPVWLTILSDQLPIVALVSRYLTNKLIGRDPLPECPDKSELSSSDHATQRSYPALAPISRSYSSLRGRLVTCYSPVCR